jgi:hypothetical protein
MPSDKPRIATYTDNITVKKFKVVSAYNDLSMSQYLSQIIEDSIKDFENVHGEIKISD